MFTEICILFYNKDNTNYKCSLSLYFVSDPQGLSGPRWQQLAPRQFSVSAGLCGPDGPPTRADATFKVTMIPGDGVGPELMTAVKEVFKVRAVLVRNASIKYVPKMQIFQETLGFLKILQMEHVLLTFGPKSRQEMSQ